MEGRLDVGMWEERKKRWMKGRKWKVMQEAK